LWVIFGVAFVAENCRWGNSWLGLFQFLAGMKTSGTVVALALHIIILGQRRDEGRAANHLAGMVENDLGVAIIELDRTADLDGAAGEAADIADIFEVGSKDDNGERTGGVVLAKVQKVNTAGADFDAQHFAGDAFDFTDMFGGVLNGEAAGGGKDGCRGQENGESRGYIVSNGTHTRWPVGFHFKGDEQHRIVSRKNFEGKIPRMETPGSGRRKTKEESGNRASRSPISRKNGRST